VLGERLKLKAVRYRHRNVAEDRRQPRRDTMEALWRVFLEVISDVFVKLLSRQDTVVEDPKPLLDTLVPVSSDDLLDRFGGLLDQDGSVVLASDPAAS
jgi:hypothetical protein